ncbi:MAG: hypothetical protein JKY88_14770 [Pseudomonadales bacterium]|nr:hypothetical protein [Pseudomonadales bacterium]
MKDYTELHNKDIVAKTSTERDALNVVNEYMDCWNARDISGLDSTLHFPHIRIASGRVHTIERGVHDDQFFQKFIAQTAWEYSLWDYRHAIQSTSDKVHFAVQFTRYQKDAKAIGVYPSMWIVTKIKEQWGIQARSSFAP